ncbi:pyridoxamine 5'-phosphate oxidase family protein [Parvularcula sp. LCG005]|uniref:pyridoxamine 5'-phosphate oxidase family protein n=1 Tax=Parvularcula sp. LCG005 TaxID=3078805 RepID=UPI0029431C9D|nr:pyridoxamine 5'-phosphate oxidase family protein [Parvularcula sp. LCG005]WOI53485.1 pyridoxamine 5'-phosphate oxidase family protein [Parvularcula sp. LCG005]
MGKKTLKDISNAMRNIDIAMLSTHSTNGQIAGRPMSNNRDVDYDGQSYFFTNEDTRTVDDIRRNAQVGLAYKGDEDFHIAVEGEAALIKDREAFREHWTPDLDRWFKNGPDTDGVILIKVEATRIHYWDGLEEGEVKPS